MSLSASNAIAMLQTLTSKAYRPRSKGCLAELSDALIAKGMLSEEDDPVVGEYPEAEAAALWNYIYISHEDKSKGVHNPGYTIALLQASIDALK